MTDTTPAPDRDYLAAQVAALRAENERLQARLAKVQEPPPREGTARRVISLILVILAVVGVVAGVTSAWIQTTIMDEDRFVETFAPLPKNPAVATALSERLADELVIERRVPERVEELLPPDLAFVAVPVTEGIYILTAATAEAIVMSDAFSGIWQFALRSSHVSASAVLSTGGKVSIDLNEAGSEVLSGLEDRGVTFLSDRELELPEIVLFQNEQLQQAAGILEAIDTMGWLVALIALALIAAAIWVSPDRRRTTAMVGFGTALGLLVTLVVFRVIRAGTVSDISDETLRAAAEAVWDTTFRFYRQSMWAVIVLALIVGFIAWSGGPSERAGRARAWWQGSIARWQGPDAESPTTGFAGFVAAWKRPLQWGALVIGLLFLLVGPSASAWLTIITALVVFAVIAVLEVVGGPQPPPGMEPEDEPVAAAHDT